MFHQYGAASKNYKLIFIPFRGRFLCIMCISTWLNYIKLVWHNPRNLHHFHVCNFWHVNSFSLRICRYVLSIPVQNFTCFIYYFFFKLKVNVNIVQLPCSSFYKEITWTKVIYISKMYYYTKFQDTILIGSSNTTTSQAHMAANSKVQRCGWPLVAWCSYPFHESLSPGSKVCRENTDMMMP
jgi:hypothetical protein